jgi:hypothetical protein
MLPCLSLDDVLPQLQCYKVPEETSEKFLLYVGPRGILE